MKSLGVIVHESPRSGDMSPDWLPSPLGTRAHVHAVIWELTGITTRSQRFDLRPAGISLELEVGAEEPPLSVIASGVFDDGAVGMLVKLCTRFGARFYNSEQGRFVI